MTTKFFDSKQVQNFERQLERIPHNKRAGFVESFYIGLIRGEKGYITPLSDGLQQASDLLIANGFSDHADKLRAHGYFRNRQPLEEIHRDLFSRKPDFMYRQIEGGKILPKIKQEDIAALDIEGIHEVIMMWVNNFNLGFYQDVSSPAIQSLEREMVETFNDMPRVSEETLPEVRATLGPRAGFVELYKRCEDFYVRADRRPNSSMSKRLEFEVTEATPVAGPHFVATRIEGYHGVFHSFREEYELQAPKEANAVLVGNPLIVNIRGGRFRSPIAPDRILGKTSAPDDEYHLVPVQFFNVVVDRSLRLRGEYVLEINAEDANTMEYDIDPVV